MINIISWLILFWGVAIPILILLKFVGLTGFRYVTRFEKHDSFFYRMNPVTKLALGVGATVVASTTAWFIGAGLTVILLILFFSLKDGRRKFMLGIYIIIMTVVGVTWTYAPYTPILVLNEAGFTTYTTIWVWPGYFGVMGYLHDLTLQALIYGMQISMRFTAALLAALVLVMTSTPSGILRGLKKVGMPEELNFAMVVAMRSVPRIFDGIDVTVKSQFMRGLGSNHTKYLWPFYTLYAAVVSILPVFIYLLKGARNTAISADTRAFRAFPKRTYLNPMVFTRLDYIAFVFIGIMIAFVGVAIELGWGRAIPYVGF
ncbi:MAG: energy-coupling factor transporter transmembrane protein EcfT [Nitrososphaerota archaeon]|nr:energy-coupling factor transporter transmembrane protein EcfT [Nitrososphaerota archaeon]MDG7042543.1 energy-coupling factor transporter transmembrane protein EcfT [Nitrososphaerota archaeon]